MELYVLDWETHYSAEYTLSSMTTEVYVRDPRFETIGVGVVRPRDGMRKWFEHDEFKRAAAKIDWSRIAVLAHHAHFDGLIMSHHYGINPAFWFDTLSMGNAVYGPGVSKKLGEMAVRLGLGEKGFEVDKAKGKRRADFTPQEWQEYGAYCLNDCDLAYRIFQALLPKFSKMELELIDVTIRMFTEPQLELNEPRMREFLAWEKERKQELLTRIGADKSVLMSNDKFAALLREWGIEPEMKATRRKQKDGTYKESTTYAFAKTDSFMQGLLEDPDDEIRWLAEARVGVKSTLNETRTERYLSCWSRGLMPVYLKYAPTHTHRWGGGDKMNWQNLQRVNKKKPWSGTIRKSILAPKGYKLCVADASQIEARWTGYLAGETWLVEAFDQARDVYSEMASVFYNRKVDRKANPEDEFAGFVGKVCIAEGSLVLTDRGLVPIEQVKLFDRVWDGLEWVSHDGVIYQGVKDVIEVDGLCATPDHIVYTEQGRNLQLREAQEAIQAGERLAITEVDGRPIRLGEGCRTCSNKGRVPEGTLRMSGLRGEEANRCELPAGGQDSGVPVVFTNDLSSRGGVGPSIRRHQGAMHEPQEPDVETLRRAGSREQVSLSEGVHQIHRSGVSARDLRRGGDRQEEQRRALRAWEPSFGNQEGELQQPQNDSLHELPRGADPRGGCLPRSADYRPGSEVCSEHRNTTGPNSDDRADHNPLLQSTKRQTKRVYDIVNAGPRHRFTVSSHLVANCVLGFGFGMGWYKAALNFLAGPMGADPVIFTEREYEMLQPNGNAFMSNPKKVEAVRSMPSRLDLRARFIHCIVSEELVKRWRMKNAQISGNGKRNGEFSLWKHMEQMLAWMNDGVELDYGQCGFPVPVPIRVFRHGWQLAGFNAMHFKGLEYDGKEYSYLGGKSGKERVRIHGPAATENIIQYLARCTTAEAMVMYRREFGVPIKMMAHDEVVSLPREEEAQIALSGKLRWMKTRPQWAPGIPLNAEGDIGDVYGEIK